MDPFLLLLIGLATVLGGILWLRLHPFIALFIAALLIASITPKTQVANALADKKINERVKSTGADLTEIEQAQIKNNQADYANNRTPIQRITQEFGVTFGKIGLVIALACLIGRCLLASGAADRIVRAALSMVGEKGAPVAFLGSGFALGIPVFFDSLFLLAIPIVKATWLKVKKNYVLFVVALVAGGTMTHSLVPPTPGPLFVAEELGVNLGTMILTGIAIGLCCSTMGLLYAHWINKRMDIPLRETPEAMQKLEELANRDIKELPSLSLSLLPILLPVVFISGVTIYKSGLDPTQSIHPILTLIGDKNIALTFAAAVAMLVSLSSKENPVYLKYTIYTNYGLPEETKKVKFIRLYNQDQKATLDRFENLADL